MILEVIWEDRQNFIQLPTLNNSSVSIETKFDDACSAGTLEIVQVILI